MRFVHLLGIAGVAEHERPAARLWAKRLEWPMVGVACWIVLQWYLEETQAISPLLADIADWLVWLSFLLETSLLTALVADRRSFLFNNWLNLVIIGGGFPHFWQFAPLAGLLRSFRLALVTMVLSGIVITRIDPSVGTVWDGMWWATATSSRTAAPDACSARC